jgi:hypothetical protein
MRLKRAQNVGTERPKINSEQDDKEEVVLGTGH